MFYFTSYKRVFKILVRFNSDSIKKSVFIKYNLDCKSKQSFGVIYKLHTGNFDHSKQLSLVSADIYKII